MEELPVARRLYYRYLGQIFWLTHWTDTHSLLWVRLTTVVKLVFLFLPVVAWLRDWGKPAIILAILLFLWIQFTYWRARRNGFYRFISDGTAVTDEGDLNPLPAYKRVPMRATGAFSVKEWEENVLFRPAEYWKVPLGDHVVMVEHQSGRFLYQFFNARTLQNLECGWLLFGSRPHPALAVTFLSTWGPEFGDAAADPWGETNGRQQRKTRRAYFSFEDETSERAVWENLVFDARQARQEEPPHGDR